ncbi:MAG: hypothetical protein COW01_02140 [Bdellovibrionales bacterium CG12_big_fil_rev_8_21_14_0_65_38_15]|nr:MAG: hypothetical protein COW79_02375 [Bdellovibrionales bacterium CG22_combo_CG10-13_8_21_14_all_38_13]PIQ57106.1 MAG: hypothetical protein COW01_02140 [Bdellovibrionales bacterium CG12_big_fil_rev_8_21_14_0_65_38_15]PIR30136.1 MAG: hypothetical protein COV38_07535 [Bdellovibrionales bacterium CG11_big_fil_rev_8_21_14_0_20_38_13]
MNRIIRKMSDSEINDYANQFNANHSVLLSDFFEPSFLEKLQSLIDKQTFEFFHDPRIGKEYRIDSKEFYAKLNLIFSSADFLNFFRQVSGKEEIRLATTRVYKILDEDDYQIHWHNDNRVASRVLSLRIELSKDAYEGGEFQLRRIGTTELIANVGQLKYGETFLFQVDFNQFEHQVLQVTKGERVSLVIWFLK